MRERTAFLEASRLAVIIMSLCAARVLRRPSCNFPAVTVAVDREATSASATPVFSMSAALRFNLAAPTLITGRQVTPKDRRNSRSTAPVGSAQAKPSSWTRPMIPLTPEECLFAMSPERVTNQRKQAVPMAEPSGVWTITRLKSSRSQQSAEM